MFVRDMLIKLFGEPDLALDLGTANTRLYAQGRGLVCDEPSEIKSYEGNLPALIRRARAGGLRKPRVLACAPTDAAAVEVIESGVCLTGGGSYLPGMKELVAAETSLDVRVSGDPLRAVINGSGEMLAVGSGTGLWRF